MNQPGIKLNEEAEELHSSEMMDGSTLSLNVSVHIEHSNLHEHTPTHCLFFFFFLKTSSHSFIKRTHTTLCLSHHLLLRIPTRETPIKST